MTDETALDAEPSASVAATVQTARSERPLGEIIADLWQNFETAVRQELKLASAQLDEKTSRLKHEVTAAVTAGALLYAGVLATVASLILLLAKAVAPWLAALLVGVVSMAAGYALLKRPGASQTSATAADAISGNNNIRTTTQETR
jgi:hypothetical protein